MSLEHAKKHAKAYDHVVTVAKELAAFARCRCHECWTGRGRHDPHGCLWADIEDLRLAVEALDSVSNTQQDLQGVCPSPMTPSAVSSAIPEKVRADNVGKEQQGMPSEEDCSEAIEQGDELGERQHQRPVGRDGGERPAPTPGTFGPDGSRRCEFCGCNSNAKQRRCCTNGEGANRVASAQRPSETHPCLDCGRPTSYFAQKMQGGHWLCRDGEGCNVPRASEAKSSYALYQEGETWAKNFRRGHWLTEEDDWDAVIDFMARAYEAGAQRTNDAKIEYWEGGWIKEGNLALCPECKQVKEGTISWHMQHEKTCSWNPAGTWLKKRIESEIVEDRKQRTDKAMSDDVAWLKRQLSNVTGLLYQIWRSNTDEERAVFGGEVSVAFERYHRHPDNINVPRAETAKNDGEK